jgi:acyl-coenzyme A thioesterase PaaI-like protein
MKGWRRSFNCGEAGTVSDGFRLTLADVICSRAGLTQCLRRSSLSIQMSYEHLSR